MLTLFDVAATLMPMPQPFSPPFIATLRRYAITPVSPTLFDMMFEERYAMLDATRAYVY